MLVVLALGRLRRADHQVKASLGFTDILSQKQKQEPIKRERRNLEEEEAEAPQIYSIPGTQQGTGLDGPEHTACIAHTQAQAGAGQDQQEPEIP